MYGLIWSLIILLVLIVIALVLAERFLAARNPRHMARSDIPARPATHRRYQQPWPIEPHTQLQPDDGEPPAVSRATEVVNPTYLLEDAQRRRG